MAQFKVLEQAQPAAGNTPTLWTVPAGQTWVGNIRVCNNSGAYGALDTYRIFHIPGGGSPGVSNALCYDEQLNNQTSDLKQGIAASAGDVIGVASLNGTVAFTFYGETLP